ncbi:hypothetical protein Aple_011110 [Acrocarpospora pleiomorpha]|uniref:DUF1963 domain-containing protein n=2 Tax=Acrocarpospora pleiomorpha TaxID=90975 RepID=A0A5M3XC21_9ACTN|nr:hypothetical protein Aple_011110 [Acrocarpospora pleiomorpha]
MVRTTPLRPVDIASIFPELAPLARQAVRLHPRPGIPTPYESSIGGPLLWPANEKWPVCTEMHDDSELPVSLDDVRRRRALLEAAWLRPRGPKENLLSQEERALLDTLQAGHPSDGEPNALLPVAQLYLRDIPGLPCPDGADLLQVLWCPLDHETSLPAAYLVWRDAASVVDPLVSPPEPADVDHYGNYVPEPCILHPEPVIEYPAPHELPEDLLDRLAVWARAEWTKSHPEDEDHGSGDAYYQYELSVAPGWKLGGWGPWSFSDPWPMLCATCKTECRPLLTVSSGEWDGGSGSWIPLEDRVPPAGPVGLREPSDPPMVSIGRGYNMQIYICPVSFDHPHLENMQ